MPSPAGRQQFRHISPADTSLYMMAENVHDPLNSPLPPEPASHEEQLVARAVNGDEGAFGDLYERYLVQIYNYIYYRVNCRQEAEDLSEGVFLRAWKALDNSPPSQVAFRIWLYRIAHNVVVDHYRARKDWLAIEAAAELPDPVGGPEETVAGREDVAELRRAILQLSEAHQEVLTCRFIAGLSHTETASVMARSEQAVRALQYRAIASLRTLLKQNLNPHKASKNGQAKPNNGTPPESLSKNGRFKNGSSGSRLFINEVDSYV